MSAAKKASAEVSAEATPTQDVVMVGNSRGCKHGDRHTVDAETAEKLVREGLARSVDPTSD